MKVLVIGASGHVGSYLVKELIKENYEVYAVMRGNRVPYGWTEDDFNKVTIINKSREDLHDGDIINQINADVICDLISFNLEQVNGIIKNIHNDAFYVQIGSIWTYENKEYLPVDELHPKNSVGEYGKQKGIIEDYLLNLVKENKLRATVIHPGHVSGKEWQPINPQGNLDITVFDKLKNGEEIVLPYLGLTTLQHIHSYDLAKIIIATIKQQSVANGQAFIAVAEKAMTLRAICENLYSFYGQKSNLKYVTYDEFEKIVGDKNASDSLEHMAHSPCCSVEKAKKLLGVEIKYSIMDIYLEYINFNNIKK